MQKYAFLDRDGTFLIEPEKPEGVDPRETFPLHSMEEFEYVPGAIDDLRRLWDSGFRFVMVTNQTHLGSEQHSKAIFDEIMRKIYDDFCKAGMYFDFVMVCPHGPDEGCTCRKPAIGGLESFLATHDVDLKNSWMFGDRETDGEFAKNLGVKFMKLAPNQGLIIP